MLHHPFLRRTLGGILLAMLGALPATAQSTANGYLKIDDRQYEITHLTAIRVPNTFDSQRSATRLALSDLPVTEEQLKDPFGLASLKRKGGFHGFTLEIGDDRSYVSLNLWSSDHDTMLSLSGTMDEVELSAQTPTFIAGQVKNLSKSVSGLRLEIYTGFSAVLKEAPAVAMGEAKTGAAAAELESVKTYLAMRKAIRAADMDAVKKLARYPDDFEGAEGAKFVKLMQSEEPLEIEVVEASESGDTATLTVTGTLEGKPIRRTFDMQKQNGKWSTKNDNWQAN